jgi:uncharacterized membrane protein/mono/diheme cytochrome c family protein
MLDSPYFAVLGRVHPMVLHMPIGILVALLVLEVVALVRRRPLPREVRVGMAWMAAGFAVMSVLAGLQLSRERAYTHDGVWLHQWLGISTGVMAVVCAVMASWVRVPLKAYLGVLVVATAVMIPAGHFGAEITHGDGFVFEPLAGGSKPMKPAGNAGGLRGRVGAAGPERGETPAMGSLVGIDPNVAAILKANCVGCHNQVKLKGGLALDSVEGLRNGGDDGAVVVAGNPGHSEVMIRLLLTPGDKEHMPPPGKRALSAEEVEVIRKWIEDGAKGMEQKP